MTKDIKYWLNIHSINQKFPINKVPSENIISFEKFHLKKKFKILEIGYGHGNNLNYLKSKGYNVYGIDISNKLIKYVRNNYKKKEIKKKIKTCSFEKIDFPNNYFNAVYSDGTMYYGSYKNFLKGIREINRVLKKNGIIRIYTKNFKDKQNYKIYPSSIKINSGYEKGMTLLFLSKKKLLNISKPLFKNIKIGIHEFNYISSNKINSFLILNAEKK